MQWAYGVTTVPERFDDLLPKTLVSLERGGFPSPRLFVDGPGGTPPEGFPVTRRDPRMGAFPNWLLALLEIYQRDPVADRYAIFQDDLVCSRNIRDYLDREPYPRRGYWSLYTAPRNEKPNAPRWFYPQDRGYGALALVFNNALTRKLIRSARVWQHQESGKRNRAIDGWISTTLGNAGYRETCHNPSLVQHTGDVSAIGNPDGRKTKSRTFRGEAFNAASLVRTPTPLNTAIGRDKRVGLVGYNVRTGLGELNRQISTYLLPERWLVVPHQGKGLGPLPDETEPTISRKGEKVERWLSDLDAVIFCETPYFSDVATFAKRRGKRVVCVPMLEWTPADLSTGWPSLVDLWICPTRHAYNELRKQTDRVVLFPWPIDVDRYTFRKRDRVERFLYLHGNGGWRGRKGGDTVRRLVELWPEIPLTIISQAGGDWPGGPNIDVRGEIPSNADLYDAGDVLLCPHSVDGLGLEPLEAMASGMPVVVTAGNPWNENPAIARIRAKPSTVTVKRPVEWRTPEPDDLARICRDLHGQNIADESQAVREWARNRSWHDNADRFEALVFG